MKQLTEYASFEDLDMAMDEATEYGYKCIHSNAVRKAFKAGKRVVSRRVNTSENKYPVLYTYVYTHGQFMFRVFLVLQGNEGESYAGKVVGVKNGKLYYVIHSHAINRYIERSKYEGTFEQARDKIFNDIMVNDVQRDFRG